MSSLSLPLRVAGRSSHRAGKALSVVPSASFVSQEQEGTWETAVGHLDGGTVSGCAPAALLATPGSAQLREDLSGRFFPTSPQVPVCLRSHP